MVVLSETLEKERKIHAFTTSSIHKESYGQYFTPYPIAKFMSSLFPATDKKIKLLDPGAGIGTLSCSFMERIVQEHWKEKKPLIAALFAVAVVAITLGILGIVFAKDLGGLVIAAYVILGILVLVTGVLMIVLAALNDKKKAN